MLQRRIVALWLVLVCSSLAVQAATGKVIKVLPHYLDREGHHALTPSLFDRDAYQARLRKNPELCSTLRYDVQWRARATSGELKLRLEIRATLTNPMKPFVMEKTVKARTPWSRWTGVALPPEDFKKLGSIIAWRVSLWEDGQELAEQKSFLW